MLGSAYGSIVAVPYCMSNETQRSKAMEKTNEIDVFAFLENTEIKESDCGDTSLIGTEEQDHPEDIEMTEVNGSFLTY